MRMTSVRSDDGDKLNMAYQPTAIDIVRMIELGDVYSSLPNDQHTLDYNSQARLSVTSCRNLILSIFSKASVCRKPEYPAMKA